jgi:monoamine oxidase
MLTRRTFIASGAAAAFVPGMALAAARTDVAIIGAGLSGMNAAMILREQGYKVVVLEADIRVGGRVETVDTADGPLDVGASQIGRGYARVLDMCQRLNLKLIPEDRDLLTFGGYLHGQWVDPKSWAANPLNLTVGEERKIAPMMMGSAIAGRYNPLKEVDEWLDPRFAEYDISLRELMRRKGHSEAAIALAANSVPGIGMDETSVLRMWQEEVRGRIDRKLVDTATEAARKLHPFGEVNDRNLINGLAMISNIEGGTSRLPQAMAAQLGDAVRLGKRVAKIAMQGRGATVTCTDGSVIKAKFVVSAIPFSMLREVEITGSANPIARAAITKMPYANTARLYLNVEKPFWKEDGLPPSFSTDGPMGMFWAIDNHSGAGRHRAMIVLVGKMAAAIASKDRPAAETFLLEELYRMRPAARGLLSVRAYKDWQRDPLQKGCSFSLAPGHINAYARDMLKPWQALHFAGEHTRRMDIGMEAAMESGERAALEIIERG